MRSVLDYVMHPVRQYNYGVYCHFINVVRSYRPYQGTLKKFRNHILQASVYFTCLEISKIIINFENEAISSNVLSIIPIIVGSFVEVLN